jgi:hypothetical protein
MSLSNKIKPQRKNWSRKPLEVALNLDTLSIEEVNILQHWLDKIEESLKSQERMPIEEENRLLQLIDRYRLNLNLRKFIPHA